MASLSIKTRPSQPSRKREPAASYPHDWFMERERLKEAHPDTLVAVRCGDFWEFFDDDAVAVSAALGIVLAKLRFRDAERPSCGFPVGWYGDQYLERLRAAGHRVELLGSAEPSFDGDARPLTRVEVEALKASGALDQMMRDASEREAVARITAGIGEAWARHNLADAEWRAASSKATRTRARLEADDALNDVALREAALAGATPRSAADIMAMLVLLADRVDSLGSTCEGDDENELRHGQAERIVGSVLKWLAAEHDVRPPASLRTYTVLGPSLEMRHREA